MKRKEIQEFFAVQKWQMQEFISVEMYNVISKALKQDM